MSKPEFLYVTYIRTTPDKLWAALTDAETNKRFWLGAHQESEWKPGAAWRIVKPDGSLADSGEILECVPQQRLVIKWRNEFRDELKAEGYSRCTMQIEPAGDCVKLTVTHTSDVADSKVIKAVSGGWPLILSNLKSLLETGNIVAASWN